MADTIESRLAELDIILPKADVAVARSGELLFVSGQLPMADGKVAWTGRSGEALDLEEGQQAARLCAINVWPT